MKRFKVKIKEKGCDHILQPELLLDEKRTEDDVKKFLGLETPDVEWYQIKTEIIPL